MLGLLVGVFIGNLVVWGLGFVVLFVVVFLVWVLLLCEGCLVEVMFVGLGVGMVIMVLWWVLGYLGFLVEDLCMLELVYLVINFCYMELLSIVVLLVYVLDWLLMFSD